MEQSEINYLKSELLEDLMATVKVMDEIWKYHPENPEKSDVITEYKLLEEVKIGIEAELDELKE